MFSHFNLRFRWLSQKKKHGCFNPPKFRRRSATALSRQMAWAELHLPLDLSTKDQMRRHVQDPKNEGHHTSAPGSWGMDFSIYRSADLPSWEIWDEILGMKKKGFMTFIAKT